MNNLIGRTLLNRYRIESFIGRGGMAEVYKAWDTRRATHVALKFLPEDLAQDVVFLRKFRREAAVLQSLDHPHIVRFYGFEEEGLLALMILQYPDGTSLRGIINLRQSEPMTPLETLKTQVEITR